MNATARLVALAALLLFALAAVDAAAQGREFAGRIVSVGGDSLVVEDRRGERASFVRGAKTAVEGKSGWDALATGDTVIVKWQLGDGPRKALRVIVLGSGS